MSKLASVVAWSYDHRRGLGVSFALSIVLTLLIIFSVTMSRSGYTPPSMARLYNGLDRDFNFKSPALRHLAERIYEYRASVEYMANTTDKLIGLFPSLNSSHAAPKVSDIKSDVALYRLATAPLNRFSTLIAYYPMFKSDKYAPCLKAYNWKTKTFASIDGRSARDVILKDVLKVATPTIDDLSAAVLDYLTRTNSGFDQTVANEVIANVLVNASEETLYNLLVRGYQ